MKNIKRSHWASQKNEKEEKKKKKQYFHEVDFCIQII